MTAFRIAAALDPIAPCIAPNRSAYAAEDRMAN
jgi:hypothetical protein